MPPAREGDAGRAARLAGTSSNARTLDTHGLAALRPAAPRTRRTPRATSPAPEVSRSIACFCGQVFGEDQAIAFMLHLRAEVGDDLRLLANVRRWRTTTATRQAYRVRQARRHRERRRAEEAARRDSPAGEAARTRRNERQRARRAEQAQPCACGCGEPCTRGEWRPGHHGRGRAGGQ